MNAIRLLQARLKTATASDDHALKGMLGQILKEDSLSSYLLVGIFRVTGIRGGFFSVRGSHPEYWKQEKKRGVVLSCDVHWRSRRELHPPPPVYVLDSTRHPSWMETPPPPPLPPHPLPSLFQQTPLLWAKKRERGGNRNQRRRYTFLSRGIRPVYRYYQVTLFGAHSQVRSCPADLDRTVTRSMCANWLVQWTVQDGPLPPARAWARASNWPC